MAVDLQKLKDEITDKLQQLVTLEVLTVVTTNTDPKQLPTGPYILTRLDMLQGDTTFAVHDTLLDAKYDAIRTAHVEREKGAIQMVHDHIALIEKAFDKIKDAFKS